MAINPTYKINIDRIKPASTSENQGHKYYSANR